MNRLRKLDPFALAAIRVLMLTGARLREVLHMQWTFIDLDRGMIFLPDSKTGQKAIYLSASAAEVAWPAGGRGGLAPVLRLGRRFAAGLRNRVGAADRRVAGPAVLGPIAAQVGSRPRPQRRSRRRAGGQYILGWK